MNSLQYIDQTWPFELRLTNDGTRALWRELNRFSGEDASGRAFRSSHGDNHFEKRFRNAISLADDYFISYEGASESIDAVLLYYGSMWLAHAVNYIEHSRRTMEHRKSNHGIKPQMNLDGNWPILEAKLSVADNNATFALINRAFGGDDLNGKTFDALDFLRAIPELDRDLKTVTTKGTNAIYFTELHSDFLETSGTVNIQLDQTICNEGYFRKNVVVWDYLKEKTPCFIPMGQLSWHRDRASFDEIDSISLRVGSSTYFLPTIQGLRVSEFSIYLAVLYALSELVRYYPDAWLDMMDRGTDEHFIIRQFIHLAEEKLPLFILNHLSKKRFVFKPR